MQSLVLSSWWGMGCLLFQITFNCLLINDSMHVIYFKVDKLKYAILTKFSKLIAWDKKQTDGAQEVAQLVEALAGVPVTSAPLEPSVALCSTVENCLDKMFEASLVDIRPCLKTKGKRKSDIRQVLFQCSKETTTVLTLYCWFLLFCLENHKAWESIRQNQTENIF